MSRFCLKVTVSTQPVLRSCDSYGVKLFFFLSRIKLLSSDFGCIVFLFFLTFEPEKSVSCMDSNLLRLCPVVFCGVKNGDTVRTMVYYS